MVFNAPFEHFYANFGLFPFFFRVLTTIRDYFKEWNCLQ